MDWRRLGAVEMILGEAMALTDLPIPTLTVQEASILDARLSGKSMRKIAEDMGLSHATISEHLAKPHVQAESNRRTEGALEAAKKRYVDMLPVLVDQEIAIALGKEVADGPLVKALQNALDRAGMAATKKTEVSGKLETTTPDIAAMQARLAEIDAARTELLAAGDEG